MRRLAPTCCAFAVFAGCAAEPNVSVTWTIDGAEPTAACAALPDGTDVDFVIRSRDSLAATTVTETTDSAPCADGGADLVTGPVAEVVASLRHDDDVVGVAAPITVGPGLEGALGVDSGAIALVVTAGTAEISFSLGGKSCAEAGATSFSVSVFENAEPLALVAVDGAVDISVPCTDGVASVVVDGLRVGAPYIVQASTTVGDTTWLASGDGFVAAARSAVTVDLQAR
jgi:hypothetical protein